MDNYPPESWGPTMVQDAKRHELELLHKALAVTPPGQARSEIRRKIAFAERIIRMRDGIEEVGG